jgi:hypothetical protein
MHCYPSAVACASVVSALCGLGWVTKYHQSQEGLLEKLAKMVDVPETVSKIATRRRGRGLTRGRFLVAGTDARAGDADRPDGQGQLRGGRRGQEKCV